MTNLHWRSVEVAARPLGPSERKAVLGDLLENGESAWTGLLEFLGLAIRRQLLYWKSWQPRLAAFGLALPGSFLLMGISVSVSSTSVRLMDLNLVGGFSPVHDGFSPSPAISRNRRRVTECSCIGENEIKGPTSPFPVKLPNQGAPGKIV